MKEERYTNLILEEMRGQFEAVMEIVGDSNERIKDLPTRDEFDGLKADVAAIKLALTDTNAELRTLSTDHKATGNELALLERRVAKLKQKSRMKLYSWNVNGIRAVLRKGELQKFLAEHQPDILCLQETKAEQGQAEFDAPEYIEYWNSSKGKKGYSGTAIFTKIKPLAVINDIPPEFATRSDLVADGYGEANDEGRVIAAEFDDFYVVTAYTPNAKDNLGRLGLRQQFDRAMTLYCADLQRTKPVLYCGDMNVAHTEDDLANPKANKGKKGFTLEERAGFDNWLTAGFVDVFRRDHQGNGYYTWWSHFAKSRERNVGWRIDYWLASSDIADKVTNPRIHPDQIGSDHCPVSIELTL